MALAAVAQEKNPERNAYFGEDHLHTSWSVDAWIFGNRITGPDDGYKSQILEFMEYDASVRFTCAGSWSCHSGMRRHL